MNLEIEMAREELNFWRDFAVWWKAKHLYLEEPRIQEALGNAELRYENALRMLNRE